MRRSFFICFSIVLLANISVAQKADDIVGTWINAEKDRKIQIYRSGTKYAGKISWMKFPYEADGKTLKKDHTGKASILNSPLLFDFVFDKDEWNEGRICDPSTGKNYHGTLKVKNNVLDMHGYIGFEMLGKSVYWYRVEEK